MDASSRITAKGQVTVPKPVRDALGLEPGDDVVFRVEGERAVLARTPDLLSLAGAVEVPPERRSRRWEDIRREVRRARGQGPR